MASTDTLDFRSGERVDALDTDGIWNTAKILQVTPDKVFIKYDGWDDAWNEWIGKDSKRLAGLNSHTLFVKCWAKMERFPWWPALVTIRLPENEKGAESLALEERLSVEFIHKGKEGVKTSHSWVPKENVNSFHDQERRKKNRIKTNSFRAALAIAEASPYPTTMLKFVRGTLPDDEVVEAVRLEMRSQTQRLTLPSQCQDGSGSKRKIIGTETAVTNGSSKVKKAKIARQDESKLDVKAYPGSISNSKQKKPRSGSTVLDKKTISTPRTATVSGVDRGKSEKGNQMAGEDYDEDQDTERDTDKEDGEGRTLCLHKWICRLSHLYGRNRQSETTGQQSQAVGDFKELDSQITSSKKKTSRKPAVPRRNVMKRSLITIVM